MPNQEIKCKVDTCKYHSANMCSLHDITVGESKSSPHLKSETECASFESQGL